MDLEIYKRKLFLILLSTCISLMKLREVKHLVIFCSSKNYLILNNNANYKKMKIHDDIDVLYDHGDDDESYRKKIHQKMYLKKLLIILMKI